MTDQIIKLKKGHTEKVRIESLAFGGSGVGKLGDGRVVFVERTAPGDIAEVKLYKIKKDYAMGFPLEITEPSDIRIEPRCPHFKEGCGGCTWQFLSYDNQINEKQLQFNETITRLSGLSFDFEEMERAPDEWYYRNKMEYTFGLGFDDKQGLGLHKKGRWSRILDLKTCFLLNKQTDDLIRAGKKIMADSKLPAFDPKTKHGFWQNMIIREGKNTSELFINMVFHQKDYWSLNGRMLKYSILDNLQSFEPSGIMVSFPKHQQISADSPSVVLEGDGFLTETIGSIKYRVSPYAFFQTNTVMARKLFDFVTECADFQGTEKVLDLYCGIGSIGLYVADKVEYVTGLEVVESAVEDAGINARLNNIANAEFIAGHAEKVLPRIASEGHAFNTVIVDPPRAGLHEKAINALIELAPEKIVYVSCNPATLARDLKILIEQAGYKLKRIKPFDLFPQTYHIEGVAYLIK